MYQTQSVGVLSLGFPTLSNCEQQISVVCRLLSVLLYQFKWTHKGEARQAREELLQRNLFKAESRNSQYSASFNIKKKYLIILYLVSYIFNKLKDLKHN